ASAPTCPPAGRPEASPPPPPACSPAVAVSTSCCSLASAESGVAGAAADGAAAAVPAAGRRAARPAHLDLYLQLGGGPVRGEVDGQGGQRVRERGWHAAGGGDRKSTRLNSSHVKISYAVFCLKK